MRCPVCILREQESTLHPGMPTTTCMGVSPGYYDARGDWVRSYDPNITTTEYRCSRGHTFVERSRMGQVFETNITNSDDAGEKKTVITLQRPSLQEND